MAEIQTANATLSGRLSAHVRRLAGDIGERNVSRPDALHAAAAYIEQVWAGEVAPSRGHVPTVTRYPGTGAGSVVLDKGDEMGRFNMGSTVIVVLPPMPLAWDAALEPGCALRMGQALARFG